MNLITQLKFLNDPWITSTTCAAHAAQQNEKRQVAQALQAQKQAQAAEAYAFRGLHLKSNHHWDEVWIRNRACVFGRLTLQSRMREMTEIS